MNLTKDQRNLIIAVIIGALIFFLLPAGNGLTEQGVRLLAVFIPTIYLWMTVGGTGRSLGGVEQRQLGLLGQHIRRRAAVGL